MMTLAKTARTAAVALIVGVVVLEIALRLSGVADVPIYVTASGVEYYPAPNQSGTFLHRTAWHLNDQSFGNDVPWSDRHPNCLLVGDSVVFGGNIADYNSHVGTLAGQKAGIPVWSASAGGWSLTNELAFLDLHRHQTQTANKIVFVLNNGDFEPAAKWSPSAYPTHRPRSALWFAVQKYLLPHEAELPPIADSTGTRWVGALSRFFAANRDKVVVVLYPNEANFRHRDRWEKSTAKIRTVTSQSGVSIIDVAPDKRWGANLYRDGTHPNSEGREVLAEIVASACRSNSH